LVRNKNITGPESMDNNLGKGAATAAKLKNKFIEKENKMSFYIDNNEKIFEDEKLEKAVSRTCKGFGLDDKTKLELIERINGAIYSDFLYELREHLTNNIFESIEDEEDNFNEVPLKGKVSWDDIYRIVDDYIVLDWLRCK